jgi:hypothetical protein
MIPQARHDYRRWMFKTGIYALAIGGILFLPTMIVTLLADGPRAADTLQVLSAVLWCCVALLVGYGVVGPYLRFILAQRYDPNALPIDFRKMWGESQSVSKDEFIKVTQRLSTSPEVEAPTDSDSTGFRVPPSSSR